ncbi:MAG: alanine racemase [Actinomycetes bacterium]
MMRVKAEVDLSAIAANISHIKSQTNAQLLAVVKADAYGHGLVPVAEAAINAGASWLGVALLEEALVLRAAGLRAPIIAWLTPPGSDFVTALKNGVDISIPSIALFNEVLSAGEVTGITPRIHVEVDTGMSRGGFLGEWPEFLEILVMNSKNIHLVGFWSHFARADEPKESATATQLARFKELLLQLRAAGLRPDHCHLANSAATLTNAETHFDLVRVGIAMYGLSPDVETLGSSRELGLLPAMVLKAKLNLVKSVRAGSPVGYGGTAIVKVDTKLGVVAMGYADGIPRNTSSAAHVLVAGELAPVIGRVSMDQFVVDLGINSTAQSGDWVTVFGLADNSADQWASASGTINYEIVTRIGPRVPRIYLR